MKILFIAQTFPYPLDTGSRNHVFHWLDAASRDHDVHLLWIGDPARGQSQIPGLPRVRIDRIRAIPAMKVSARVRRLAEAAARGIPPTSLVCMRNDVRGEIMRHIREENSDVIVLAENAIAGYAPVLADFAPVVLLKPSVQAVDAREERRRSGMWHPRWMLEEWIVRRFEGRNCRAATAVCVVNAEDVADLAARYGLRESAQIVPIGVDLSKFPGRGNDPGTKVIGFFGNLTWGSNIDAVRWYAKEIMPKVSRVYPGGTFRVIGTGGENLAKEFADPNLEFTGRVESIPQAMSDVAVGIVPVFSGTGVRFKLLEMLSLGVPVVTTTLGALGTGCIHGEHALIADDADTFASAVVKLLDDAGLRQRLTEAGRKLIQNHSWQSFYPRITNVIEKATAGRSNKSGRGAASNAHSEPKNMLTIFSTPKPFTGHAGIIQRNALKSWTLLYPDVEVILFGDDEGSAGVCRDLGIRYEPNVRRNENGTKYLNYMFDRAYEISSSKYLCYANCDIMLMSDFCSALKMTSESHDKFLMIGRRWDTDITQPWDFQQSEWENRLKSLALTKGKQNAPSWVDYFCFSKDLYYRKMPDFLIGRHGWDPWLTWFARSTGVPLVDASRAVVAVHQNHDYAYLKKGPVATVSAAEADYNLSLGGSTGWRYYTTEAATEIISDGRLKMHRMAWFGPVKSRLKMYCYRTWWAFLGLTRPIRHRLGWRKKVVEHSA